MLETMVKPSSLGGDGSVFWSYGSGRQAKKDFRTPDHIPWRLGIRFAVIRLCLLFGSGRYSVVKEK